jgi:hypothetical protein
VVKFGREGLGLSQLVFAKRDYMLGACLVKLSISPISLPFKESSTTDQIRKERMRFLDLFPTSLFAHCFVCRLNKEIRVLRNLFLAAFLDFFSSG